MREITLPHIPCTHNLFANFITPLYFLRSAMTPSRTSSIRPLHNSATTGHLLNPSSGGGLRPGAVTQSRRASSTGLAGATSVASPSLRRQKTISEMKLPSSSTTAARLKGRGANTSVAAAAAASVAWKAPPAKGSLLPRSTSFQPNGQGWVASKGVHHSRL